VFELKVVRERRPGYGTARKITTSRVVYEAFRERFERSDREEFLVVPLDGKNQLLGFHVVSVGRSRRPSFTRGKFISWRF
jgi:DNA repair protein RadC